MSLIKVASMMKTDSGVERADRRGGCKEGRVRIGLVGAGPQARLEVGFVVVHHRLWRLNYFAYLFVERARAEPKTRGAAGVAQREYLFLLLLLLICAIQRELKP